MGKWWVIMVVLAVAAGAAWYFTGPGSQRGQVCDRLEALCGPTVMPSDACMEELDSSSDRDLETLSACVEPAESCIEVTGCLAGSVARDLAVGAVRGVLR